MVTAGTGSRFIVLPASGFAGPESVHYTPDAGDTWVGVPAGFTDASLTAVGHGGTFAGMYSSRDGIAGVRLWNPDSNTLSDFAFDTADLAINKDNPFDVVDFVGSTVVLDDGRVFDLTGERAVRVPAPFPASSLNDPRYALTDDAATVVRGTFPQADAAGYITAIPLRSGRTPVTVAVRNLLGLDVDGSDVHYLAGSAQSLRLCVAPAMDIRSARCVTLARGDYRASKRRGQLTTSAGADQVSVGFVPASEDPQQWLVTGRRHVRVPGSYWTWLPFRDSKAPMALVRSIVDQLDRAAIVDASGRVSRQFGAPGTAHPPAVLTLTAGRVLTMPEESVPSDGSATTVSERAIGPDGTVGPAKRFARVPLSGVVASAGRTAVQWDRAPRPGLQTDFYDGHTRTGTVRAGYHDALDLSGPYARVGDRVVRVDGQVVRTGRVLALFGSLVVEASSSDEAPGRTFRVRDLDAPGTPGTLIDLPQPEGRVYLNNSYLRGLSSWQLAGDWVSAHYQDPGEQFGALAFNVRTGRLVDLSRDPSIFGLGEGWALLGNTDDGLVRIVDLTTGDRLDVTVSYDARTIMSDRSDTITWAGDASLDIARVEGLPVVAPRLLGALAAPSFGAGATWQPAFDLTKPVQAGRLELRDAGGRLVRTLPTPAAPEGSVRGARWDGRDQAGAPVAPGTYTWTLVAPAADGSGATLSVDGTHAASGRVRVGG